MITTTTNNKMLLFLGRNQMRDHVRCSRVFLLFLPSSSVGCRPFRQGIRADQYENQKKKSVLTSFPNYMAVAQWKSIGKTLSRAELFVSLSPMIFEVWNPCENPGTHWDCLSCVMRFGQLYVSLRPTLLHQTSPAVLFLVLSLSFALTDMYQNNKKKQVRVKGARVYDLGVHDASPPCVFQWL